MSEREPGWYYRYIKSDYAEVQFNHICGGLFLAAALTGIGTGAGHLTDGAISPDGYESVAELEEVVANNAAIIREYPEHQEAAQDTAIVIEDFAPFCLDTLRPYLHRGALSDIEEDRAVQDVRSLSDVPCGVEADDIRITMRSYDAYLVAQDRKDTHTIDEYNQALVEVDGQREILEAEQNAKGWKRGLLVSGFLAGTVYFGDIAATYISKFRGNRAKKKDRRV